ncbi:hypothetical protein EI534_13495 [Pseudomonas frederiksbergensis]|nr:hypothetical protein [Pseudomonas frederiksbergensis]
MLTDRSLKLKSRNQGCGFFSSQTSHQSLWERACPRWRRIIQHLYRPTLRNRGQARSHRV